MYLYTNERGMMLFFFLFKKVKVIANTMSIVSMLKCFICVFY